MTTNKQDTPHFDLPRLIKDLGGPSRVQTLLFAENLPVPRRRNLYSLSAGQTSGSNKNVALLAVLARRLDPQFDLIDYLEGE